MTQRIKHTLVALRLHVPVIGHVDDASTPIDHRHKVRSDLLPCKVLAILRRHENRTPASSHKHDIGLRHQTRHPLASIPAFAIAHQPHEHRRTMRIIQAAVTRRNCRLQITVIQHAFSRFPIRIDERTDLILHLRVRQPRIIRNNLHIIHADLHTRTIQTSLMRRDNRTVLHRPQATHIIRIRGRRQHQQQGSRQHTRTHGEQRSACSHHSSFHSTARYRNTSNYSDFMHIE